MSEPEGHDFRYSAFVSYRHLLPDRQWARWLVERLEVYRTPRPLIVAGAPQRVGYLFRDDDEIPASSDLSHQIDAALASSRHLIVICSRATPASVWVSKEIDSFVALGRAGHILVLLIDGEAQEAIPANLWPLWQAAQASRTQASRAQASRGGGQPADGPHMVDVRHITDRNGAAAHAALLAIAAILLRQAPAALAHFDDRRRLSRRRLMRGAMAAAGGLLALQGLYYWDQHRIKYRYFTDVTAQWGVPVGLGEITAEQASRRTFSIALAYQGGEVVGAKAVNGAGLPMAVDDPSGLFAKGTAQIWLTRTDHRVTAVELLSATGKRDHTEIYAWQPDGSALVSLVRSGGGLSGGALGEPAVPTANTMPYFPSTIAQYRLSFNAGGQLTQRLFRNAIGAQAAQEDGSVGYAYAYDGRGYLVLRRTILSAAGGEASLDRAAQLRFHVNAAGLGEETDWLDAAGHPVPGDNGYARLVRQFDRAGNVVAERYTDGAGRPAIDKASGAASVRLELDGHGLRVVQRYFGTGAEPVRNAISGAFVERYRFDGQGRIAAAFWHDRQDRPMITATGAAGQSYAYDARGNRTDAVFLDAAGQPVAGVAGYVREHAEYDDKGNLVELAYQDGQGRPAANARLGYARTRFAYDERGNAVAIRRFGQDGQPVADANGNALYAMVYDDRNYLAEVHFLGPDGKPFAGPEGVAGIITHFDDQGRLTGVSYVDEQGNAALNSSTGTSFVETEYDERGRPIAYRYYDKDQRPVLSTQSGSAAVEISYNDAAHSRTETFLGLRDEPVAGKSPHCASLTIETDPRGNDVLRRCGDGRGGPMRDELGAAMVRWAYDSHDRMISAFYLDEAGHLARIAAGYAGVLIDLDDAGHPIRRRFVDIDGRAAVNRVTGTAGFDESYDALGHMVSRQFVGLQGQRAVDRPEGYWALRQKYDARGNAVEIRGLDTDGQPARLQAVGAFVVRFGYDAYNWQNEVRYLDLAGHLMLSMNGQGPAHIIQQRNAWRQETGWLNLDAADRPFMPAAGQERFARATFTYDPSGHQTAATYFDAAGHRIPAPRAGQ